MAVVTPPVRTLALLAVLAAETVAAPVFHRQTIFDPAVESHGHVHASCHVELPGGALLAVWYENGPILPGQYYTGDADKRDDVRIGSARLPPGAARWEKPFVMADTFGVADDNPSLLVDREKRLWLVYPTLLAVPDRAWGSSLLQYKISTDYNQPGPPRWSKQNILVVHPNGLDEVVARQAAELRRTAKRGNRHREIAQELLNRLSDPFARRLGWMPRTHPVALRDGAVLIPFANENFDAAAVAITRDAGETWTFGKVAPSLGITQPSIVELPNGRLLAFFRDAAGTHRIARSESADGGMSWGPVTATTLANPGAGIEALLLRSGALIMVYNPVENSPRDKIAVSISDDEGRSWPATRIIESRPGGRFDYPSVIQTAAGTISVTYSDDTKTIRHAVFNEEWIRQQP